MRICIVFTDDNGAPRGEKRSNDEPQPSTSTKKVKDQQQQQPITCRRCLATFPNHRELYNHRMLTHRQQGGGLRLQDEPWVQNPDIVAPWTEVDGTTNDALKHTYQLHRHLILKENKQSTPVGGIHTTYNFPITNDVSPASLTQHVEDIYAERQNAFKINISFGLILYNVETREYRYFIAYNNDQVFPFPIQIVRREDLEKLKKKLTEMNIANYILRQRPNTKFKPVLITNVHFNIYESSYVLGTGETLPEYLLHSSSIVSFQ
jgi:hypothetical protein